MKKAKRTTRTIEVPERPIGVWIGEWLLASMVLEAWKKEKRMPVKIRLPKKCFVENKDGSGTLKYDVEYKGPK